MNSLKKTSLIQTIGKRKQVYNNNKFNYSHILTRNKQEISSPINKTNPLKILKNLSTSTELPNKKLYSKPIIKRKEKGSPFKKNINKITINNITYLKDKLSKFIRLKDSQSMLKSKESYNVKTESTQQENINFNIETYNTYNSYNTFNSGLNTYTYLSRENYRRGYNGYHSSYHNSCNHNYTTNTFDTENSMDIELRNLMNSDISVINNKDSKIKEDKPILIRLNNKKIKEELIKKEENQFSFQAKDNNNYYSNGTDGSYDSKKCVKLKDDDFTMDFHSPKELNTEENKENKQTEKKIYFCKPIVKKTIKKPKESTIEKKEEIKKTIILQKNKENDDIPKETYVDISKVNKDSFATKKYRETGVGDYNINSLLGSYKVISNYSGSKRNIGELQEYSWDQNLFKTSQKSSKKVICNSFLSNNLQISDKHNKRNTQKINLQVKKDLKSNHGKNFFLLNKSVNSNHIKKILINNIKKKNNNKNFSNVKIKRKKLLTSDTINKSDLDGKLSFTGLSGNVSMDKSKGDINKSINIIEDKIINKSNNKNIKNKFYVLNTCCSGIGNIKTFYNSSNDKQKYKSKIFDHIINESFLRKHSIIYKNLNNNGELVADLAKK